MHLSNLLTVLSVSAIVTCCIGSPPSGDRWVWGRRQTVLPPVVGVVGAAAVVPSPHRAGKILANSAATPQLRAQRRHGRVIDDDTETFKSITARSFPTTHPLNGLQVQSQQRKQVKPTQKATIKPSTIDTTFTSHFDVFSSKIAAENPRNNKRTSQPRSQSPTTKSIPALITTGEYPYPFGTKPVDLGDGTSIGWAPEDTLLIHEKPGNKGHSNGRFTPPRIAEEHDARYTTLDKLFTSRGPTKLPDTHSLSNDVLGGLHPDEVYYADKDLVIIKGGGFATTDSYHIEEDLHGLEQSAQNTIEPSSAGNELGEANEFTVTNVRPDAQFTKVPLPLRFVNGNIPTIVKPFSSNTHQSSRQHRTAQRPNFRPVANQTPFIPFTTNPSRPFLYVPASSQQVRRMITINSANTQSTNPTRDYQNLDEEVMVAEPSETNVRVAPAPTKRSADSSVVSYHYQTRGSGNNAYSIVNYQVHREGSPAATSRIQNPNIIQLSHKETVGGHKKPQVLRRPQAALFHVNGAGGGEFGDLEDLSVPEGASILVPNIQTPRRRPSTHQAPPPTVASPHFVPSIQQPRPAQQHGHVRPTQQTISLAGDTRVNYLHPLPPINRQAEFLGRRRQRPVAGGNRSQARPVVTRNRGGNQPAVRQQGGHFQANNPNHRQQQGGAVRRFMEPRRRTPIRRRQNPVV